MPEKLGNRSRNLSAAHMLSAMEMVQRQILERERQILLAPRSLRPSWENNWPGPAARYMPLAARAEQQSDGTATAVLEPPSLDSIVRVEPGEVQESDCDDLIKQLAMDADRLLGYRPLAAKYGVQVTLKSTLDRLQIATLDTQSVFAYKRKMVNYMYGKMAEPEWRCTPIEHYTHPIPEHVLDKAVAIKKEMPNAGFAIDELRDDPFLVAYDKRGFTVSPMLMLDETCFQAHPLSMFYVEVWDERKFEAGL